MRFKRILKDTFKAVKERFQKSILDAILKPLFLGFNRNIWFRLKYQVPIKETSEFAKNIGIILINKSSD